MSAGIIDFNMYFFVSIYIFILSVYGKNIIDYLKQVPPPKTEKI